MNSKQSRRRFGVTYFLGRPSSAWRAALDASCRRQSDASVSRREIDE